MDNSDRLKMLEKLRRPTMAKDGFESHEAYNEWVGNVAPLLNFNAIYYENFLDFSSKVQARNLSVGMYEYLLRQLDSLVAQAITELKLQLTPQFPPDSGPVGDINPTIQITGNIGILNTGQIGSIQTNITNLTTSGHSEMAEALRHLAEAVAQNEDLSPEARSEILDQLDELGRQAVTSPDQRAKLGIIKAIFQSLAASLAVAGNLAEVWSTWGIAIKKFFGL